MINQFLSKTYKRYPQNDDLAGTDNVALVTRPTLVCNDGFTMSVQASSAHMCTPKQSFKPDLKHGSKRYYRVEVGFPSENIPEFLDYLDWPVEEVDSTNSIYAYVPVEAVEEVIVKHGGIDEKQMNFRLFVDNL
tara:strand:+ start:2688 stop:3089 length:402 start_codon:yes stop_codon:yes gene_type:complete